MGKVDLLVIIKRIVKQVEELHRDMHHQIYDQVLRDALTKKMVNYLFDRYIDPVNFAELMKILATEFFDERFPDKSKTQRHLRCLEIDKKGRSQ